MSVAVYLRTRGPSASAIRPVPALFLFDVGLRIYTEGRGEKSFFKVYKLEFLRTRVRECVLDGAFRCGIRWVGSALGSVAVVVLTTKTRC